MFRLNLILFSFFAHCFAFYDESQYVKDLTEENFQNEVINGKDIWIIQFFSIDNANCRDYSDEYENAGKAIGGFVKVGAVDVDKARLLAYRYNVKKLPTIIHINKDKTWQAYEGEKSTSELLDTAKDLIAKDMQNNLKDNFIDLPFVREFNKNDIDKLIKPSGRWIVAYHSSDSPVPGYFKVTFSKLATQLQDIIKFGYCNVSETDAISEVTTTPTIFYYFGKRFNRSTLEYNGTMKDAEEVISWALSNVRRPNIMELEDEDILRDLCVNKKYCIISIIKTISGCNKECQKKIKNILRNLAEKYKHYSVAWALVTRNAMPTVEDLFEMSSETVLPIMIAVNVQTLKSKALEDFDETKAQTFLEDIFHGNGLPENRLPGFDNLLHDQYKPWHDEL